MVTDTAGNYSSDVSGGIGLPQISDQQSPIRNLEHRSDNILINRVRNNIDKDI
jgi:hypothetical protein